MDTSEKYIKMCSKATEIQEIKKNAGYYVSGDFVYCDNIDIIHIASYEEGFAINESAPIDINFPFSGKLLKTVFLPRQDQLQEMVIPEEVSSNWDWMRKFILKTGSRYYIDFSSFEQLWLAFVMKEKYNKVWDEKQEDWVKIDL